MTRNEYQKASDASHIRDCFEQAIVRRTLQRVSQSELDALYRFESSPRTIADAVQFSEDCACFDA